MPKKNIRKQQKLEAQNFDQQNFEPQIPLTTQVTPQMGEYDEYSRLNGDGEQVRSYTGMGIFNPALVLEEGNFNLVGMNDGVLQAGISADDGKFFAGGGDVSLDSDGINLIVGGGLSGAGNTIKWVDNLVDKNILMEISGYATGFMTKLLSITARQAVSAEALQFYLDPVNKRFVFREVPTSAGDVGIEFECGDVSLGAVTFDQAVSLSLGSGSRKLYWNTDRDTLNLSQTGTNLQLGQEVHFYVINQTGSDILSGTVVQYDGALGASGIIKVKKAVSDGSISAIQIMGIATQDIANGATGKVTFFGEVHDFDTSGYTAGTILYLNPSVAGGLTSTEPAAPNLRYAIAMTIDSKSNGTLMVRAIYSMALHELNDVTLTSPANGQLLTHDGTKWINKRITPTVSSETSSATPTINVNSVDAHSITALAANITSMTTNLSGSPSNFQKLTIRIKDNGTARTIAWGTSYASRGATLPTTTVISKVTTVGLIYNSVTSTWDCVAVAWEA